MPWGDDVGWGSSRRVNEQFGDLFDPGDPNPTYERDQFARGQDFGVKPISFQDYAAPPQQSRYDQYMSGMKDLYGTHPALDAYSSYLKQAPQAQDYQPSKWERLAAGLSGAAAGFKDPAKGIATAMSLNRSRYNTAMEDYQNMAKPMAEAANLERLGISDRAKYMSDVNDLMYKQQTLERQRSVDKETAAWHNRTAGNAEKQTDWNITYGQKRLSNEDRNFNSLSAYQKGNLTLGAYNAQTNRAGVGVAQQNADTNQDRAQTEWFKSTQQPYHAGPSSHDVSTALQDTMANMSKTHTELVEPDATGHWILKAPPPAGTKEWFTYQQGLAELKSRADSQVRGQINLFGGGPQMFGAGGDIPDPNEYGRYTDVTEEQ
jgi:hypothetical protein